MAEIRKIGIIGSGGWGTAISILLAKNNYEPLLWSFEQDVVSSINNNRINPLYLEGVIIPRKVQATGNLADLNTCDIFFLAVPTQFIRSVLQDCRLDFRGKPIVNLAKGIEKVSFLRVSELLMEIAGISPEQYLILTGPSHAEEVSREMPTAVVAASNRHSLICEVQEILTTDYFRVYSSDDVTGCETGGALKNIIALAAGIIDGLGLGDNTKAALITRGLAEISRLGVALGAKAITFSGLSGLGDLFVTCNSRHSRNRKFGELIGKGEKVSDIINNTKMIAEGVFTVEAACRLGKINDVELPISEQVYSILFEGADPTDAIRGLMTRRSKSEWWW